MPLFRCEAFFKSVPTPLSSVTDLVTDLAAGTRVAASALTATTKVVAATTSYTVALVLIVG
jgi:hypothetical protein